MLTNEKEKITYQDRNDLACLDVSWELVPHVLQEKNVRGALNQLARPQLIPVLILIFINKMPTVRESLKISPRSVRKERLESVLLRVFQDG